MGELFVEEGTIPGDDRPCALRRRRHDLASRGPLGGHRRAALRRHRHPRSREELRAGGVPAVQQGFAGPVSRSSRSTTITGRSSFDKILSPGHEIGFSPDGRFLCMMNNLRENNCSIFDQQRSRSTQLEEGRPCRGSAVARQVSESVPHGLLDGQLQALPLDPASLARQQRRHGGRYQVRGRSRRKSRASGRTCRPRPSPTTANTWWRRSAASNGCRAALPSSIPRPTSWSASGRAMAATMTA